jgi:hypothetical protein
MSRYALGPFPVGDFRVRGSVVQISFFAANQRLLCYPAQSAAKNEI